MSKELGFSIDSFLSPFTGSTRDVAAAAGYNIPAASTAPAAKKAPATGSWISRLYGNVADVAAVAGIKMPLDSELQSLNDKVRELRGLSFQMDNIINSAVPRLKARGTANATALADALAKAAKQAKAQGNATTKLLSDAITVGNSAQNAIRSGSIPGKVSGVFFTKKAIADRLFPQTKLRFNTVVQNWQATERKLVADTSLPVGAVRAVGATAQEFGGMVTRGLVKVGTITEDAASAAATGAEQFAPYMKYALPAAGVFVGLYLLSFLPRARHD